MNERMLKKLKAGKKITATTAWYIRQERFEGEITIEGNLYRRIKNAIRIIFTKKVKIWWWEPGK